jgi:hypothetical protein
MKPAFAPGFSACGGGVFRSSQTDHGASSPLQNCPQPGSSLRPGVRLEGARNEEVYIWMIAAAWLRHHSEPVDLVAAVLDVGGTG